MFNKLLITVVISASALLAGCANNNTDLTESVGSLNAEISTLTSKVEMLESEKASLTSDLQSALAAAEAAKNEAERANARIDNIAASYSK